MAHEPVIPLIAYRFPKAFAKHSKTCSSEKLSLEASSTPKSRSCCFFGPSVMKKMLEADHDQLMLRQVGMF